MNQRMKTVIRILLLVAKWVADDENMKKDIEQMATHIAHGMEDKKATA